MQISKHQKSAIVRILLVQRLRKRLKRKQRSCYVRPLFLKRDENGESKLVLDLRDDPHYHFRYFRMNKDNFDYLLVKVYPMISHPGNHCRPISPLERLAITIRYLASGDSQFSLACNHRVSPSSVCNIVRETLNALCNVLSEYLPTPTQETWIENEKKFFSKWNFPNACGSIDGKHIRIKAPAASGSLYYNYKNYFSIVLFAVSNADFEFCAVDIGSYGSESDGGILAKSAIGKKILDETIDLPPAKLLPGSELVLPHIILGDDAFALRHNVLKPYKGSFLGREHRTFNYRLSRARMTVENCFGILAARWRIFHSVIEADVTLAKRIVYASVLLHNYLMKRKDLNNLTLDIVESEAVRSGNWRNAVENDCGIIGIRRQGTNNYTNYAAEVRDSFKDYFLSDEGKLSWQDSRIG